MDDYSLGEWHIEKQVGMPSDLERDVHSERSGDLHVLSHEQSRASILLSDGNHPLLYGTAVGPRIALIGELEGQLTCWDRPSLFLFA